MKAISFDPQQVKPVLKEWNIPEPANGEVLIKIKAAGLNHRDLHITNPRNTNEFIYGSDGAGVIVKLGSNTHGWKIGDEVIINSQVSCLTCDYCLRGEHTKCEQGRLIGGSIWNGTLAEYIRVPVKNIEKKPEHLSFMEAAAIPLAFGTAWRALVTQAKLKPGEKVFIHGIGGGVALFSLQLSIAMGAEVYVSSGSDEKLQKAIQLGAKKGINYAKENVEQEGLLFSKNQGYDVIISSSGRTIASSLQLAKKGGRIVQFAYIGEPVSSFDVDLLMGKELTLIGSSMYTYSEFKDAIEYINATRFTPVISEVYSLTEFERGFASMKNSEQFGKIIFTLD